MTDKKVDQFVHLHSHADTSILDGFSTIPELVAEVARIGQPALAITDHGNMHGIYDLYKHAKAAGIKPIAGIEAYMAPSIVNREHRGAAYFGEGGRGDVSGRGAYTHLTLLAENNDGLKNLFRMSERSYTEGFFQKNRIDLELLSQYSKGIIATTGCPSGEIQTRIRLGQFDEAVIFAGKLQDIVGKENLYMELMEHDMSIDLERSVRDDLLAIAKKLNIPLVATNDLHYARHQDAKAHEQLLAVQTRAVMSEPADHAGGNRFAFEGEEYYVKSRAEMEKYFSHMPEALNNTLAIAERCDITIEPDDTLRPTIAPPAGMTEAEYLKEEAFKGLEKRLPDKARSEIYINRLNTELNVIEQKNFTGYFLVVSDFVRWGKFIANPTVPTGAGRGSAAGSLLAYCLDITDVDPIKYDLLFERFINPERDSPPDIDMDFNDTDRIRVIEYVINKYGRDKVAQIATFGKIGAKAAMKDVVRILEQPYSMGEELSKALPEPQAGHAISLHDVYDASSERYGEAGEFRELVKKIKAEEVIEVARSFEGRTRSTGVHAAALVVSTKPVVETVPMMQRQADGAMITQWDYPTCEGLGLLKVDFLGLRNLGVIANAVKNVEKTKGIKLNVQEIIGGDMDDQPTYDLLARGDSLGVFQLDSGGMRGLMKQLRPTSFEDISALIALYRPGPMGVNAHTDYALRKNGEQEVLPIHPELKDSLSEILAPTFNLCVAGDSMVWNADSGIPVRIDSIEKDVKDGKFFTFSINDLGAVERKKVTHWFDTGVKPIYEILSSDGRILRVSGDHPVLTLDGYKKASELEVGVDFVASSGQELIHDKVNNISNEEARLIGYLIGDGYINLYQNTLTNSSEAIIEHVSALASKLFDDVHCYTIPRFRNGFKYTNHLWFAASPQGIGRGKGKSHVYDTTFKMNRWLSDVMGIKEKVLARDKKIPDVIFGSSQESIRHFLAGLWDTDGFVGDKFAFLKTISKELAIGTQLILDKLGIHSYIYQNETYENSKHGKTKAYGVYVYADEFWNSIVPLLVHETKKTVIKVNQDIVSADAGVSMNIMLTDMGNAIIEDGSSPKNVISRIKNNSNTASMKSAHSFYIRKGLPHLATMTQNAKDNNFVRMNLNTETYLNNFASETNMLNAKQRWSAIKKITIGEPEAVYDITVEDNHNFYANGIVVHNCIYQEQIMRIAQKVADYSLSQADNLRRAMGKKKKSVLDAEYVPFSEGMKRNGYSDEAIKALWDVLVPFAEYGFNKSHSVGYGVLSYLTAYLKANHPAEFMSALLSSVADDTDKTALYLDDCRNMGIRVLPPDVNNSDTDYSPISASRISFGFKAIRGVGEKAADELVEVRGDVKFTDIQDFVNRVPKTLANKRILEALSLGGAFDGLGVSRKSMMEGIPAVTAAVTKANKKPTKAQQAKLDQLALFEDAAIPEKPIVEFDIPDVGEYSKLEKLKLERHALGLYVSGHPLEGLDMGAAAGHKVVEYLEEVIKPIDGWVPRGTPPMKVSGIVTSLQKKRTKKGETFALGTLEDLTGTIPFVMFPKAFADHGEFLNIDGVYQMSGFPRKREIDGISFTVDAIRPLEFGETGKLSLRIKLTEKQWISGKPALVERLERHKHDGAGSTNVIISIKSEDGEVWEEEGPFTVRTNPALTQEIRELFGMISIGRWKKL